MNLPQSLPALQALPRPHSRKWGPRRCGSYGEQCRLRSMVRGLERDHINDMKITHPRFEIRNFLIGHCVCLGNDGYQIHFAVESTHKFDVDGPQSGSYRQNT